MEAVIGSPQAMMKGLRRKADDMTSPRSRDQAGAMHNHVAKCQIFVHGWSVKSRKSLG
jgi:hypothetical protein